MKKLLLFLTAFVATVASGALLDVKVPQQVLASPPTWTDRVVPFESAISTTLTSYRSGMGLGTEDSPQFTGLTLSGLTDTRVVLAGTAGLLGGDADLTFSGTRLTATDLTVTNFPTFSAGTATRVPFFTTAGLVTDDSDMTFATDTLTVTKGTLGGITHVANAIAAANSLTSVALSPLTLGTGTFGTAVSFASATGIGTFTAAPSAPSYASTVATGTAPFTVASTTLVSNLHAAEADVAPAGSLTGTTLAANVVTSSLTTVGALNSGSITPGFGSIDVGADSITGGAISGTTLAQSSDGGNASLSGLTLRQTNGGNAARLRFAIGNDSSATASTIDVYSTTHATLPNYLDIFNQYSAPVRIGSNGTAVATFTSTGLDNTVIGATTRANGSFDVLAKNSGTFDIPHPLASKAATHRLVHSFIEGPRADLIYRGSVTLANGTATVNIDSDVGMTDGTFVALATHPQVWVQNDTGWTPVRGSVAGNILTITAKDPVAETVSWLVIAERHDEHIRNTSWTDANGKPILEPEVAVDLAESKKQGRRVTRVEAESIHAVALESAPK